MRLISVLLVLALVSSVAFAFDNTTCNNITASGSYKLVNNVVGAINTITVPNAGKACIRITASDVVFDCGNFNLTNNIGGSTYGIMLAGPLANVTVQNCPRVWGYTYSIAAYASNDSSFINNTVFISTMGFYSYYDNRTTFINNTVSNSSYGFFLFHDNFDILANNTAYNLNTDAFAAYYDTNDTFIDNRAINNSGTGFSVGSGNLTNNIAQGNGQNGFYLAAGVLLNNTSQESGQLDLLVPSACTISVANMTGSGNRPINFTNETVSWSNLEFSELILCNAHGSMLDNITIRGSDTLRNNELRLVNTNNTVIRNSNSSSNYNGFVLAGYPDGSNNTISNSTASNNTNYGFYVGSYTTLENNVAFNNSGTGYYLVGSYNNLTNNTAAFGNHGFYIYAGSDNRFINNTADHAHDGFNIYGSSYNIFYNNTAHDASDRGFCIQGGGGGWASYNDFTNNTAYNNGNGFFMTSNSERSEFTGNVVYGNYYGFHLDVVDHNILTNNSIYDNLGTGIYSYGGDNNALINNSVRNNSEYGVYIIHYSDENVLANNTIFNNSQDGVFIVDSDSTNLTNDHIYGNGAYGFAIQESGNRDVLVNLSGVVFDSPAGNYSNFTNLSINDIVLQSTSYGVAWTAQPAGFNVTSFAQKFINISGSGSVSIDNITWSWSDDEVAAGGYNKSRFTLYNYSSNSGTWAIMNATLDTTANTLNLASLGTGSVRTYGILQRNDFTAPVVAPNSPGENITLDDALVLFNFTVTDDMSATMRCSLYLNGTLSQTNTTVSNNTPTIFTLGMGNGNYGWYVTCTDEAMNPGTSETRNFTVNSSVVCPLIDSPGSYNLSGNVYGAPNDFSDLGGDGACARITASDVDFDCQGYNITGPGPGLTTAGVFVLSPSNVTVRNCNISGYTFGGGSYLTDGAQFINNVISNNPSVGLGLFMGTNTLMANNTVFSNGGTSFGFFGDGGLLIITSDGTRIMNDHYYGNSVDILVVELFGAPFTLDMSDVIFDNPPGGFQNYTTLSLNDTVGVSEAYTINWSSSPAVAPAGSSPFRQKFIDITSPGGTSIDRIAWGWQGWETSGYDESSLALFQYDGADWVDMNATLDTTAHTLNTSGFVPASTYDASTYGILGNRTDYVFMPSSQPGANAKAMGVNYSFACPDNKAVFSATSSGSPISGASIRLIYTEPPYFESIGTVITDDNGVASIILAREGWYRVQASRSGYQGYDTSFYFTPCAIAPPPSQGNVTQPPANTTQPQQNQTQPPAVQPNVTTEQAQQAIADAQAAISDAQAGGKNVTAAQEKFAESQAAFDAGDYQKAKDLADEAKTLALNAAAPPPPVTPPVTPPAQPPAKGFDWLLLLLLLGGVGVVIAAGAGAYFMFRKGKPGRK